VHVAGDHARQPRHAHGGEERRRDVGFGVQRPRAAKINDGGRALVVLGGVGSRQCRRATLGRRRRRRRCWVRHGELFPREKNALFVAAMILKNKNRGL
jgi:hypothetical protein